MFVVPQGYPCDFSREDYLPSKTLFTALTVEIDLGMFRVSGPTGQKMRAWVGTDGTDFYQPKVTMIVWNMRQFVVLKPERVFDLNWRGTVFPEVDPNYTHLIPRKAQRCL